MLLSGADKQAARAISSHAQCACLLSLQMRRANKTRLDYLNNAEENELKRLKTTTDEGILGDKELWAAKGRINSYIASIGY